MVFTAADQRSKTTSSILKPSSSPFPHTVYSLPPFGDETKEDASFRGHYDQYSPHQQQQQELPPPKQHNPVEGVDLLGEHALPIEQVLEAAQSLGVRAEVLVKSAMASGYDLFTKNSERTTTTSSLAGDSATHGGNGDGRNTPMSKSTYDSSYNTYATLETSTPPGWMYAPEANLDDRLHRELGEYKEDASSADPPKVQQHDALPPPLQWTKHFATDAGELLLGPALFGKCSRTCTKNMISTQEVMVTTWGDKSLTESCQGKQSIQEPPQQNFGQNLSVQIAETLETPAITRAESIESAESLEYPDDELTMISTISLDQPQKPPHQVARAHLPNDNGVIVVQGSTRRSRDAVGGLGSKNNNGKREKGRTHKSPFNCLLCKSRGKQKDDDIQNSNPRAIKGVNNVKNTNKSSIQKENSRQVLKGRRRVVPTTKSTNDPAAAYKPKIVDHARPSIVTIGAANSITAGSDGSSISLSELGALHLNRKQHGASSEDTVGELLDSLKNHRRRKAGVHNKSRETADTDPVSVFL